MGGIITVSSKIGEGTRFEVVLPFYTSTEEEAAKYISTALHCRRTLRTVD